MILEIKANHYSRISKDGEFWIFNTGGRNRKFFYIPIKNIINKEEFITNDYYKELWWKIELTDDGVPSSSLEIMKKEIPGNFKIY